MNVVDIVVVVLVLIFAFRGFRKGFLGQLFELGGGFLGLIAGIALGPRIASLFTDKPGLTGALISLIVVFVGLSLGQAIGVLIGHRFGSLARTGALGGFADSVLGAGFGIAVTLVSFWLVGSLLVSGPSRALARAFQRSEILQVLNGALPKPPDVLAYVQQYLNTSGFPQVFTGFPPQTRPVQLPPGRKASRAAQQADQSTVRIVVPACGGTQLGSGWIAADSTVVTNAHVVAGGEEIRVQDSGGEHLGRVVVFDDDTDVAVVHVEGLGGPALPLATDRFERGTPGATLGFPGGSSQLISNPAAVQASFQATGRDIYGRDSVQRDVYELRARVRQGDSGGPFVLPNGSVAGVIFAASTTDANTGYALTGQEVMGEVERGSGRSDPVSTQGCTR